MAIRIHHSASPHVTVPPSFHPAPAPRPRRVEALREAIALVSPGAVLYGASDEERSGGILLASDGSPASWVAARTAMRLARVCGLELRLVYVPDGRHPERYREVLKQLTAIERAPGPQPVVADDPGRVADRICDTAEAASFSLIVLGHRGGLEGAEELGSVSERVVRKAHAPVLLVPEASRL